MSDRQAGRAITIGWDAREAWRLIVTVPNAAMGGRSLAGTPS